MANGEATKYAPYLCIVILLLIVFILWFFFGGKKQEFIGLGPLIPETCSNYKLNGENWEKIKDPENPIGPYGTNGLYDSLVCLKENNSFMDNDEVADGEVADGDGGNDDEVTDGDSLQAWEVDDEVGNDDEAVNGEVAQPSPDGEPSPEVEPSPLIVQKKKIIVKRRPVAPVCSVMISSGHDSAPVNKPVVNNKFMSRGEKLCC